MVTKLMGFRLSVICLYQVISSVELASVLTDDVWKIMRHCLGLRLPTFIAEKFGPPAVPRRHGKSHGRLEILTRFEGSSDDRIHEGGPVMGGFLQYFAVMTATAKKETTVWAGMWTRGVRQFQSLSHSPSKDCSQSIKLT